MEMISTCEQHKAAKFRNHELSIWQNEELESFPGQ